MSICGVHSMVFVPWSPRHSSGLRAIVPSRQMEIAAGNRLLSRTRSLVISGMCWVLVLWIALVEVEDQDLRRLRSGRFQRGLAAHCHGIAAGERLAVERDFALGQRGSDERRLEAATFARKANLLPEGKIRLWIDGAWKELELFELEEREETVREIDCADRGNVATRLVHCIDETSARERFADSIRRIKELLPDCNVAPLSPAEIAFRWRGLEFARRQLPASRHWHAFFHRS